MKNANKTLNLLGSTTKGFCFVFNCLKIFQTVLPFKGNNNDVLRGKIKVDS